MSAQQTSSNFQLTVEIEQLKEQNEEINLEKDNIQNQLERNAFQHAEEKIKMESTLAQQSKLIDFLQKKVMIDDKNFIAIKKPKVLVILTVRIPNYFCQRSLLPVYPFLWQV